MERRYKEPIICMLGMKEDLKSKIAKGWILVKWGIVEDSLV